MYNIYLALLHMQNRAARACAAVQSIFRARTFRFRFLFKCCLSFAAVSLSLVSSSFVYSHPRRPISPPSRRRRDAFFFLCFSFALSPEEPCFFTPAFIFLFREKARHFVSYRPVKKVHLIKL